MTEENALKVCVEKLKVELNNFISFFEKGYDYDRMVYEFWNAKDILGHITFWHESFARNLSDLAKGVKPKPLKGRLSEVNRQSVETTRNESIDNLIQRLKAAQNTIEKYIYIDSIQLIPYKKGSRDYSRKEHLEIVASHIHKHLKDIRKIYGSVNTQE